MYIDSAFKPWLLCASEARHFALQGAFLDTKKALLVVTDGKRIATFPVHDVGEDEDGIIPPEALKAAAQFGRKQGRAYVVVKSGNALIGDGRSWPTIKCTYPNWEQVIPTGGFPAAEGAAGKRKARVMLDAELLEGLVDALRKGVRNAGATLEFMIDEDGDARQSPIIVGVGQHKGYLMPMRMGARPKTSADVKENA